MYFGDWMARGELYWADTVAVVDVAKGERGRFTYRDMNDRANRLARWLRAAGVGAGDRVAALAHNGVETLDGLFACAKLGAIFVPLNWRLHPSELVQAIELTEPTACIVSTHLGEGLAAAGRTTALPRHLLHVGDGDAPAGIESQLYGTALAESASTPIANRAMGESDIVCLLFTGGTTGGLKAARITYRQVAWNTFATVVHEVRPGDVTITHTPMFHTGGLMVYTVPLLTVGGRVVILDRWDPALCLRLLVEEKVTAFFAVPTQYQQMLDVPGFAEADLSHLRFLTSGGAPMPEPVRAAWSTAHPHVPFKQGFGMTEFGPGVFSMQPHEAAEKATSVGRANHFVEARVAGDDGHALADGEIGELWLRGPACCDGYWRDPEATAAAIDGDGWLHTGDLVCRDADGFFNVAGRTKEMFISGGENVYPLEVERVLHTHPTVALAAVVPVPDERWGEVGHAFVVKAPGSEEDATPLLEHVRGHLAAYKVPKRVSYVTEMPLSPAGKILKVELQRRALQETGR